MEKRELFCEISPLTFTISKFKEVQLRNIKDLFSEKKFAKTKDKENKLPILVNKHNSLIRRKLGNIDIQLQENKATNLNLSTPKVNGIIIKPRGNFFFLEISRKLHKKTRLSRWSYNCRGLC